MKRIVSCLLVCLLLISGISVFAEEMIVITQKPITVTYNGDAISFPDAQPLIQNGRTLVPARAIMERAKLTVTFNPETRTVVATRDDLSLSMTIDNATATVTKGETVQNITLEEPARIINDRTYVPIRFIGESMDVRVNWNANYREVVLIDTGEWKREISENAPMLDYILDMPVASQTPYAGNFSGNMDLGLILKNMPSESGMPSSLTLNFDFAITGTEVFDGSNNGSYALFEADLTTLNSLTKYLDKADAEELKTWAKVHKIDLDVIVDNSWNLYIKSEGLASLMKLSGDTALANAIGNRYAKIPMSVLLGVTFPEMSVCETYRDFLNEAINSDTMLYTQSVKTLDETVSQYINMFHKDRAKITKRYDGSELFTVTLTQDNAEDLFLNLSELNAETSGTPLTAEQLTEKKNEYEKMTFKLIFSLTVRDNKAVKSEMLYSYDTGDVQMDAADVQGAKKVPTVRTTYKINIGSSIRKFNSYTDKKITLPKNVITLEELAEITPAE